MNRVRTLARNGPAADLSKGKQPPSYTVISETELNNLRGFLEHDPLQSVREQMQERAELKKASAERVKHWPNLIETIRLNKEKDRKRRLEEEEEARCRLDKQEREYQASKRAEAIKAANEMLYKQEDRVKAFTSKLFLSHVLDERAKQIEVAEQKKELRRQKECEWALLQDEQVRLANKEEEERAKKRRDAAQRLKEQQKDQLQEVRERKLKERAEARYEGKLVREAAERAIEKEREQDEQRRQRAIEINRQYMEDNRAQREQREAQVKAEEHELKKIKLFAQLKEEQMLERRRRAEEKFNTELAKRQEMISRQAAHLEAIASEADERVLTQIRDAEREREAREAREQEKREKHWESIQSSRKRQMEMKDSRKKAEEAEKKRIAELQKMQQEALLDQELAEREAARKKNEQLLAYQKQQMEEKEKKKKQERERELEEGREMLKSLEREETMFQDYVASVMGPAHSKRSPASSVASHPRSPQPPPSQRSS